MRDHTIRDSWSVAKPGWVGARFHPNVPANFDQPWSWTVPYVENGDNKTQLCEDPCCGIRSEFSH